ncbi:MAG: DUF1700 domain-containing protein [Bacillota bacterium]
MNEYLEQLEKALGRIKAADKQDILADFREHFVEARAAGRKDAEIAKDLGDPRQVGRMFTAKRAVEGAEDSGGIGNVLRMLGAVARYKLLGGLLIICLYLIALCLALGFAAASIAILACSAASLVYAVMVFSKASALYPLLGAFLTILFLSLGLIGLRGCGALWRGTVGRLPGVAKRLMRIQEKNA